MPESNAAERSSPEAPVGTPQWFRKKPVVIEALRLDGTPELAFAARQWIEANGGHAHDGPVPEGSYPASEGPHGDGWHVMIHTPEGRMLACPDDWIIRRVQGEFYPCKPDIFAATYEEATRLREGGHPFTWVTPDDIEAAEDSDDLAVIDGRVYLVLGDGTCSRLLRSIELCDSLPGEVMPEVAATVLFVHPAAR